VAGDKHLGPEVHEKHPVDYRLDVIAGTFSKDDFISAPTVLTNGEIERSLAAPRDRTRQLNSRKRSGWIETGEHVRDRNGHAADPNA
jgi:hypothetical protein